MMRSCAVTTMALHWFPGAKAQPAIVRYMLGTLVTVGVPVAALLLTAALGLRYGHLFWSALLMDNEPELVEFFETRTLRSEQ